MNHQTGGLGGRVVAYFHATNCLDITMAWKTFRKYVATVPPPLLPLPFPSLLLEVGRGPLLQLGGLGSVFAALAGPGGARPPHGIGEFQAENLASMVATIFRSFSGNETSNRGTIGGRVVTHLCKQTVWTSQWHGRRFAMMWRHV